MIWSEISGSFLISSRFLHIVPLANWAAIKKSTSIQVIPDREPQTPKNLKTSNCYSINWQGDTQMIPGDIRTPCTLSDSRLHSILLVLGRDGIIVRIYSS